MDRTNVVLAALVAVALAITLATSRGVTTRLGTGPVFQDLEPARAVRVDLELGGRSLAIVREDEVWRLPDSQHVATAARIVDDGVLGVLARVSKADQEGATSAGFGFEQALRVRVTDANGAVLCEFDQALGRTPPSGGTFVRPRGGDVVYRASALPPLDVEPRRYWESRLLPDVDAAVDSLGLELEGAARLDLVRTGDGRWKRSDGEFARSAIAVDKLVLAVSRLRFGAIDGDEARPEHGLDAPTAAIEVGVGGASGSGSRRYRIAIGAATGEGTYVATSNDLAVPPGAPSPVVRLDAALVEELLVAIRALVDEAAPK